MYFVLKLFAVLLLKLMHVLNYNVLCMNNAKLGLQLFNSLCDENYSIFASYEFSEVIEKCVCVKTLHSFALKK